MRRNFPLVAEYEGVYLGAASEQDHLWQLKQEVLGAVH